MEKQTFLNNFGYIANSPNGVQKLRELILKLAVSGKLIEQTANDEPASILVKKIKIDEAELKAKGIAEAIEFEINKESYIVLLHELK
ncbi:MAG: hypothetical protein HY356_08865, partial [Gammaproteobacteria bacterium]|nr:hypothetical protein [Gammaproteobacteria bacterium]